MKSKTHDEAMAELYRKDPEFARQVINTILEDENGDQGELLIVLRHMTKAFGGVQAVAEQAKLNPTQLYRTLSPEGNPALSSFSAILKAMGMRLSVQPLSTPQTGAQAQNNPELANHTLQEDIEKLRLIGFIQ
jgi:probable addiction module antidote protein